MKERPILLNAEMVNAVLSGRKTQTRRVIQSPAKSMQAHGMQVIEYRGVGDKWYGDHVFSMRGSSGAWHDYTKDKFLAKCPFGAVGDRLWVRETWCDVNLEGAPAVAYRADDEVYDLMENESFLDEDRAFNYQDPRVSKCHFAAWYSDLIRGVEGHWRPSIHMPRWASRITLEITGVRVERLASVSDEDAGREGYPADPQPYGGRHDKWLWFRQLWDSIYPEQSFKVNPWVWVIEFKRLDGEE